MSRADPAELMKMMQRMYVMAPILLQHNAHVYCNALIFSTFILSFVVLFTFSSAGNHAAMMVTAVPYPKGVMILDRIAEARNLPE